jgi:hypothetical protein
LVLEWQKGDRKVFQTATGPTTKTFPLDYGYIRGMVNPQDGEECDMFVGSGGPLHGRFSKGKPGPDGWVFDEYKWYAACTEADYAALYNWWHQEHDAGITWGWTPLAGHAEVYADMRSLNC